MSVSDKANHARLMLEISKLASEIDDAKECEWLAGQPLDLGPLAQMTEGEPRLKEPKERMMHATTAKEQMNVFMDTLSMAFGTPKTADEQKAPAKELDKEEVVVDMGSEEHLDMSGELRQEVSEELHAEEVGLHVEEGTVEKELTALNTNAANGVRPQSLAEVEIHSHRFFEWIFLICLAVWGVVMLLCFFSFILFAILPAILCFFKYIMSWIGSQIANFLGWWKPWTPTSFESCFDDALDVVGGVVVTACWFLNPKR